jgi:hypothetical protein
MRDRSGASVAAKLVLTRPSISWKGREIVFRVGAALFVVLIGLPGVGNVLASAGAQPVPNTPVSYNPRRVRIRAYISRDRCSTSCSVEPSSWAGENS